MAPRRLAAIALPLGLIAGLMAAPALAADPPVGRILSYTRSNIDGSDAETIHVFRQGATQVAVNKRLAPCTTAALVTAELDLKTGQARRLTAGRLNRQGGQDAFGDIVHDPLARRLDLAISPPGAPPGMVVRATVATPDSPWMLYDFDLADLTSLLPARPDPKADFSFGMALLWPEGDPAKALTYPGRMDARFVGAETWRGRAAWRFEAGGPAFPGGVGGPLWLDQADGHVLAAEWSRPNHPGYRDFKLVLDRVSDGGQAEWTALMLSHWAGCPAP